MNYNSIGQMRISRMVGLILFLLAAASLRADDLQMHNLSFFLHPDLVGQMDAEELRSNLAQYAADVNNIYAKQTVRRIAFDPNTGITITDTVPYSDDSYSPYPEQGYELWAHVVLTDQPGYSYGGHSRTDISGAGVAWGLKWDSIHNPSELVDGTRELEEYWFQITAIVHEFEHVFGAGSSEYYNLSFVDDMTGAEPIVDIRLERTDAYWNKRQDYFPDPLLLFAYEASLLGSPTGLQELRDVVTFADVTVAVINRGPRNRDSQSSTLPDISATEVRVLDKRTSTLIGDATVHVWNVNGISYENEEIPVTRDVTAGTHEFFWDAWNAFNTSGHLKLIKAFAPGYEAEGVWFSVFDAVEQKMVYGQNRLVIPVYLMPSAGTYSVNMHDFSLLAAAWLKWEGHERFDAAFDLHPDGLINNTDFKILADHWLSELPVE